MLTPQQITAIESLLTNLDANVTTAERKASRMLVEYRSLLRAQQADNWKIGLAKMERLNQSAYQLMLSRLPEEKRQEAIAYTDSVKGEPIPEQVKPILVSDAIDSGKIVVEAGEIAKP